MILKNTNKIDLKLIFNFANISFSQVIWIAEPVFQVECPGSASLSGHSTFEVPIISAPESEYS